MKTFHTFKTGNRFEKFLRTKYRTCHDDGCLDYVRIGGIIYTMHEYDMDGQSITWANKKHNIMVKMATRDRYREGYKDAQVSMYSAHYLRSDIYYAQ